MDSRLKKFHESFFEESLELLFGVEKILIKISPETIETEHINTIFRAIHSIKGGSNTYGFLEMSEFAHCMESYLDQIRTAKTNLTANAIDLLLGSVDHLKSMIEAIKKGTVVNIEQEKKLITEYEDLVQDKNKAPTQEELKELDLLFEEVAYAYQTEQPLEVKSYFFTYSPAKDSFLSGSEPWKLFRILEEMGDFSAVANIANVPTFDQLNPEFCYLSWEITLKTRKSKSAILEDMFYGFFEENVSFHEEIIIKKDASKKAFKKNTHADTKENRKISTYEKEISSIRVPTDRIDSLVNKVGELVIAQSTLTQIIDGIDSPISEKLQNCLEQLKNHCREIQENVMHIRMLPVNYLFERFPRMVRDFCKKSGKKIALKITGTDTEIDKSILEKISDPLTHLIRNALDHGIESPEQRLAIKKPEEGIIHLSAYPQGGSVIIEVRDDGTGLNQEKILEKARQIGLIKPEEVVSDAQINEFIFLPGFSTAEEVTNLSGRGVGMDVVQKNISSLGGTVEILSMPGSGTSFKIRLPLTLALLDGQIIELNQVKYIIPLYSIVEMVEVDVNKIKSVAGIESLYKLRETYIPIISLSDLLNIENFKKAPSRKLLLVVEVDSSLYGISVDKFLAQKQVVIKSLEHHYQRIEGIAGATILGNGEVALILDPFGLVKIFNRKNKGYLSLTQGSSCYT